MALEPECGEATRGARVGALDGCASVLSGISSHGEVAQPGRLEHPWGTRHPLGYFTVTEGE
jgi:hypothetical protein